MTTLKDIIQEKAEDTRQKIAEGQRELAELERQASEQANKEGIEAWRGNIFESSSELTPEFATFARAFKKHIISNAANEFELVNWSRGHFDVSGFLKNKANGKLVYFSTCDVRQFPDAWYNDVLIRTAQHDRDYTGGSNCYASLNRIIETARRLTR